MSNQIRRTLDKMRERLLDLTGRNPLLNTRFSERSHSHVRVVDELPEVLFQKIASEGMTFEPLPYIDTPLEDEKTDLFKEKLLELSNSDEDYKNTIKNILNTDSDYATKTLQANRDLIDKVRNSLNLEPRSWSTKTLDVHARQHNINPNFNLPESNDTHLDERHIDRKIQTLMLPEDLDKRLDKIIEKNRLWTEELGVHVLFVAYGFLEWKENDNDKPRLAPLILQNCNIDKKKTNRGSIYTVRSDENQAEMNLSLKIKLETNFGIILPEIDEEDFNLETYLQSINKIIATKPGWKVLRQVTIGIFPSSKQVLYNDLDSKNWNLNNNTLIKRLFGSHEISAYDSPILPDDLDCSPYTDDAPWIVCDADSSQYAVIKRLINKENLAVEGPPGTGKSQTIVNAIAAAITEGKKVLFVAEKKAALDVVNSRLKQHGLENFCLSISSEDKKSDFYKKLKKRTEIGRVNYPKEFENDHLKLNSIKRHIDNYLHVINKPTSFGDYKLRDILGKIISNTEFYESLSTEVKNLRSSVPINLNPLDLSEIQTLFECFEKNNATLSGTNSFWKSINNKNLGKFEIEDILDNLKLIGSTIEYLFLKSKEHNLLNEVEKLNFNDIDHLKSLTQVLNENKNIIDSLKFINFRNRTDQINSEIKNFFFNIDTECLPKNDLGYEENLKSMDSFLHILNKYNLHEINHDSFKQLEEKLNRSISSANFLIDTISSLSEKANHSNSSIFAFIWLIKNLEHLNSDTLELIPLIIKNDIDPKLSKKAYQFQNSIIEEKNYLNSNLGLIEEAYVNNSDLDTLLNEFTKLNFLSIFSLKYWNTWKNYKKIDPNNVKKDKAIKNLKRVIHWKKNFNSFVNCSSLQKMYGNSFKGLDTNFKSIIQTHELIESIKPLSYSCYDDIAKVLSHITITELNFYKNNQALYNDIQIFEKLNSKEDLEKYIVELKADLATVHCDLNECRFLLEKINLDSNVMSAEQAKKIHLQYFIISKTAEYIKSFCNFNIRSSYNDMISDIKSLKDIIRIITLTEDFSKDLNNIFQNIVSSEKILNLIDLLKNCFEPEIFTKLNNAQNAIASACETNNWFDDKSLVKQNQILKDLNGSSHLIPIVIDNLKIISQTNAKGVSIFLNDIMKIKSVSGSYYNIFQTLFFNSLGRNYWNKIKPENYNFDFDKLRSEFSNIDKRHIKDTQQAIQNHLLNISNPRDGRRQGKKSTWTEMALINNEILKEKRHISIRSLISRSKHSLLELMPCWMMSPMAVAQYLPTGEMDFDIIIIDEASQMTPENAMGSILRGKQAMIVGDTNQLPPTNFFQSNNPEDFNESDDDEIDESFLIEESILSIANSAFHPQRRLRWHYRSKHSSLIAFSNEYIYDRDLEIFPSNDNPSIKNGIALIKVDGKYSSGLNELEADAIVDTVVKEMKNFPEESIAVVTMNKQQTDLIHDKFQLAKDKNPHCIKFIEKWDKKDGGLQKFTIKNLENIQGDERDTVIIGTLYGPDKASNRVLQRFGPINGPSGKRRLNVLFTRAKSKTITVTSLNSSDILASKENNEGAWLFKKWIEYASTGKLDYSLETKREPDSDFERHVIKVIESLGCIAEPQVGVSGYFIDIGVRHPLWENGYLMGVECDGATYHSQKTARDRDRLREEVLSNLGWDLYRIWSTAWFQDTKGETERLRKAIESKLIKLKLSVAS